MARQQTPVLTASTRRLMVASEGMVPGRRVVVLQLAGLQAQRTGRSWRAAHSRVATTTQGCSCTYFCWTSSATCCRAWYNTGQSSRSIARLLSGDSGKKHQLKPCQRRELLLFQLLPTSLKDVEEFGNEEVCRVHAPQRHRRRGGEGHRRPGEPGVQPRQLPALAGPLLPGHRGRSPRAAR